MFRFYSPVLEKWTVERLWATAEDLDKGWYKLDNIPFYILGIACDDIVFAEWDATEDALTFREVINRSGNSTVQVVIINVPATVDYAAVLPRLSVLFMKKVWTTQKPSSQTIIVKPHKKTPEKPKKKPWWQFW